MTKTYENVDRETAKEYFKIIMQRCPFVTVDFETMTLDKRPNSPFFIAGYNEAAQRLRVSGEPKYVDKVAADIDTFDKKNGYL